MVSSSGSGEEMCSRAPWAAKGRSRRTCWCPALETDLRRDRRDVHTSQKEPIQKEPIGRDVVYRTVSSLPEGPWRGPRAPETAASDLTPEFQVDLSLAGLPCYVRSLSEVGLVAPPSSRASAPKWPINFDSRKRWLN